MGSSDDLSSECNGAECNGMPLTLTCTRDGDRAIIVTRTFKAPRERIFAAYTQPSHLMRWFYGPDQYPILSCDMDLRKGGALRYVWQAPGGKTMGLSGTFSNVVPNEHIAHTELFDEDWTDGEAFVATDFSQTGDVTTVSTRVDYASAATADKILTSGMLYGWDMMLSRLDAYLARQMQQN